MSKKESAPSNPDFWDNLGKLLLDMGLIVFSLICIVPLFILGGIITWREKRWEKHHKGAEA